MNNSHTKTDSNSVPTIDFVITWVNGEDPAWLEEKRRYSPAGKDSAVRQVDTRDVRTRPWDTLRYLFRGIEKYAPWVNKVHFVTWGHLPEWLDVNCTKLNVVRHRDYIPEEYLPTFSSRTIELNFHRIEGLSETFVNFNDDTLIIDKLGPSDFFNNGLPCCSAVLTPYKVTYGDWFYAHITNISIINKYFDARSSVRQNLFKWINAKYGVDVLRTILMLPYPSFFGIRNYHLPDSILKETIREIWGKEPEILNATCSHKFRVSTDPNQWLIEDWQIASGRFSPRTTRIGRSFQIENINDARKAADYIRKRQGSLICVNDIVGTIDDYMSSRSCIEDALNEVLSGKSSFELF